MINLCHLIINLFLWVTKIAVPESLEKMSFGRHNLGTNYAWALVPVHILNSAKEKAYIIGI